MDTTWDGLPITPEWPRGASVVVRRVDGAVLLLHRAQKGPDHEGLWAWTTPAGARGPGEAILPGALRELAEEAGLSGIGLTPVDLTGHWALFTAEAGLDARVTLHDVEHDRYEWVSPADAYARVFPPIVADGIRWAMAVALDRVTFRPLRHDDLPSLVAWLRAEHVRRWWTDAPADVGAARAEYGPVIDGTSPTSVDVVLVGGRPVGFVQATPLSGDDDRLYFETARWATDGGAETVSIDYAIGEETLIGQGLGTRVIWSYIHDVITARFPGTRFVVADPAARNTASVRACEKAGFRRVFDFVPEQGAPRHALCVFDVHRVLGSPHPVLTD